MCKEDLETVNDTEEFKSFVSSMKKLLPSAVMFLPGNILMNAG